MAFDYLNSPKQARYGDKVLEEGMGKNSLGSGSAKKDSRLTHLRTSFALVKGGLGTKSTDAHYTMVHRGL